MKYYEYEEFFEDVKKIAGQLKENYIPDAILAIARGGLTFGHFLAHALDKRELFALNSIHYEDSKKLDGIKVFNIPDLSSAKKILIVDDIVDSGETLLYVKNLLMERYKNAEFKTATLFYKENTLVRPDFWAKEASEWVKFLWDFTL